MEPFQKTKRPVILHQKIMGNPNMKSIKDEKKSPELLESRKSEPFQILTRTSHSSSENYGESKYEVYKR